MEVFNFFTEITGDVNRFKTFEDAYNKLKPLCENVQFVSVQRKDNRVECSIIGQIIAEPNKYGNLDLGEVFKDIEYFYFEVDAPENNNFPKRFL
ncbi:hypothetical protein QWY81_17820 [Polaribacter undariae]|uniref:Uncharacterized protein n=1 Tax=Polaribacter sejongensis TaxID=985043 RepID=A0AAJ1R030_9FLAO|nr:hypothetical protein [Polaribacter undariae]MDN3621330.1 hypothetical protein [Polaribacter undariae]UWD31872.1 hypothetical protein NQP51_17285 [Polaribacter undariae]